MNVELIDDPELIALMGYGAQVGTRTKGAGIVHLSDIYKILMQKLQPRKYTGGKYVDNPFAEGGILFESILEEAMARKFATVRPAELVTPEGVYCSPDGVNPSLVCGEEYKCTWKSSRHGVVDREGQPHDKFLVWFIQMKGYAHVLEILDWMLRVFFVNGNYNRSGKLDDGSPDPESGPNFKTYRVTFTQEEVDENWAMLMTVARGEGMLDA